MDADQMPSFQLREDRSIWAVGVLTERLAPLLRHTYLSTSSPALIGSVQPAAIDFVDLTHRVDR